MEGPWYQETEMSRSEARNEMFEILKGEYTDETKLNNLINEVINDAVSMCSVMGYYVLGQREEFKKNIIEKYMKC